MLWKNLLQKEEIKTLPWLGGGLIHYQEQSWLIIGDRPEEYGWYNFIITGRSAIWQKSDPLESMGLDLSWLTEVQSGYLAGDRFLEEGSSAFFEPNKLKFKQKVYLIPRDIDRFVKVKVGKFAINQPLVFLNQEFSSQAEIDVLNAFLMKKDSVNHIRDVSPALDLIFNLEVFLRAEVEKKREALRLKLELEEKNRVEEEKKQKLKEQTHSSLGRRNLAKLDFALAAEAALKISGAEYLHHQPAFHKNEMLVTFRYLNQRFECICDSETLQIIDSGICLTESDGYKHDKRLSLESLPSVIEEAQRTHQLVITRTRYDEDPISY